MTSNSCQSPGENGKIKLKGRCHCGRFSWEFLHPPFATRSIGNESEKDPVKGFRPARCNCSLCSMKGYIFSTFLKPSEIIWTSQSNLSDASSYTFGTNTVHHYFCPVDGCAIAAYRDEDNGLVTDVVAVTLNCVYEADGRDFDVEDIFKRVYDGKNA
ncbi:hypothetical protein SISSUDRAFT_397153 [Sistotremastrum suecicum HHB10207 ss-3]|uniref:CENP-V/GFA domain-containing protein n=1 Tax=Sistotremastrum suecicum HHB10207 ss-3 TaxID=1314776 RepID=A0A165YTL1_9AGAM|nr:hypothetical protein SISSUDRAFT_397153 [Sistotremastrum suecicum HHB10207 ss-3]